MRRALRPSRLAFNEAFVELGMEGASWSEERYLSLLRTGGAPPKGWWAVLSLLRVPHPELRDPTAHIPDEVGQAAMSGSMRPAGWNAEGASVAAQAAAIQAAASRTPSTANCSRGEGWSGSTRWWRRRTSDSARSSPRAVSSSARVRSTSSTSASSRTARRWSSWEPRRPPRRKGVLDAVLEAIGPLRAAAITQCGGHEQIDGCEFQSFENYHANNIVKDITANGEVAAREEQLQAVNGDVDVRKEMQAMMKQRKGELLAEEIGGDLQRQRFDSNVVVDSGVFCTSTRA